MTNALAGSRESTSESPEVIVNFAEVHARCTGPFFCSDNGVMAVVLKDLARHCDDFGGALGPCRHYEDKLAEVPHAFRNLPCLPVRKRKECHSMLFLTEASPIRGDHRTIITDTFHASAGRAL